MTEDPLLERKKGLKKLSLKQRLASLLLPRSTDTITEHYL